MGSPEKWPDNLNYHVQINSTSELYITVRAGFIAQ